MKTLLLMISMVCLLSGCAGMGAFMQGMGQGMSNGSQTYQQPQPQSAFCYTTSTGAYGQAIVSCN